MSQSVEKKIGQALKRLANAGVESPLLDAQIMMARVLKCSRLNIIAHSERVLTDAESADFESMLEKRSHRCPLAYITGYREFYDLELEVSEGVLIPRPETEILVEECLKRLKQPNPVIADIGVGSGAIAVALAMNIPDARVFGTEVSNAALGIAQSNINKYNLADRVIIYKGDLVEPLIAVNTLFDAIVSNPPYIPTKEIETLQPEVKLYEPKEALDGGEDGLDVYRRLIPAALRLLGNSGFLAVEIGVGEAVAIKKLALDAGYGSVDIIPDLAEIERVVVAHK